MSSSRCLTWAFNSTLDSDIGAGPVGFEPTILGSEGPRLGPGSTTGPSKSMRMVD